MRRMMVLGVLTLGLMTVLASPAAARGDRAVARSAREFWRHAAPSAEPGPRARHATARGAAAGPLFECDEAPEGLCGRVEVPLDRADPAGRTVGIFFHFYPHTDTGRAPLDPIFASSGGPGVSITQEAGLLLWVFGPSWRRLVPRHRQRQQVVRDDRQIRTPTATKSSSSERPNDGELG